MLLRPVRRSLDPEDRPSGSATVVRLRHLAIAALIVASVFPDVLFLGASIKSSRLIGAFERPVPTGAWLPETAGRAVRDGFRDLTGPSWQWETAHAFMRNVIRDRQSPYWNPYSASGTVGPERMVSAQFSITTLLIAVLGATSLSFHVVIMAAYVLAVYCLFRALRLHLQRSALASAAACYFFLLNGFNVSMLGAQMLQPYVLGPVLLHSLLRFVSKPSAGRFAAAAAANALLLTETFVPTMILVVAVAHAVSLARSWSLPAGSRSRYELILLQLASGLVGFLLVAPLWLPILESYSLAAWGDYEQRRFVFIKPQAGLALFTPKHFWEHYLAFERMKPLAETGLFLNKPDYTRLYHLGIVAVLLATHVWVRRKVRWDPVVLAATAMVVLPIGRTFGFPPFHWMEYLPGAHLVSLQYWGAMLCLSFAVLLAYGFDELSTTTAWRWPSIATYLVILGWIVFLGSRLGLPADATTQLNLAVLAAILISAAGLLFWVRRSAGARTIAAVLLMTLMVGELVFYMNRLRPKRLEIDYSKYEHIDFVRKNLDGARLLNIGTRGIHPNLGSALGLEQIDSLDGINLRWYASFFERNFGKTHQFLVLRLPKKRAEDVNLNLEGLDLLGVRYIVTFNRMSSYKRFFTQHGFPAVLETRGFTVFENTEFYPRAFAVPNLMAAPLTPDTAGLSARDVAFSDDERLLSAADGLGITTALELREPGDDGLRSAVRITDRRNASVTMHVTLEAPAVVVLMDTWHPSWTATSNGEAVYVGRVNEAFRGLVLPAGEHTIVMKYAPRTLGASLALCGLAAAALALLGWPPIASRWRRRWVMSAQDHGSVRRREPSSGAGAPAIRAENES